MTHETEPTPPEIILSDPAYWAENIRTPGGTRRHLR